MLNAEYSELIRRLGLTRREFSELTGVNIHTVESRCREGKTRITARAHSHILEFAVSRLLRMKISGPAPRIRHAREIPEEFERKSDISASPGSQTSGQRRPTKAAKAATAVAVFTGHALPGFGAPQTPPPQSVTCAYPNCHRPVEGLPHARLCVQHGQEAQFLGIKRFH